MGETSENVTGIRKQLEANSIQVEDLKANLETITVQLKKQRQEIEDKRQYIKAKSEKLAEEKVICVEIKAQADEEIAVALPFLQEAEQALASLTQDDILELKSYEKPPKSVEMVMDVVCTVKGIKPSWENAKKDLDNANFIKTLESYDKNNMSDRMLKKIGEFVKRPEFSPENVAKESKAAEKLCIWVRAMDVYGRIWRIVAPKHARLRNAERVLQENEAIFADTTAMFEELIQTNEKLERDYKEKRIHCEKLVEEVKTLELKLKQSSE